MKNRTGTFTLLLALALAGAGNAFAAEDSTAPNAARTGLVIFAKWANASVSSTR